MAGRYKKKEEERKSEYVKFRCTPSQKEQILKNCGEENLSSFLLKAALRRKNKYVHLSRELSIFKLQLSTLAYNIKYIARVIGYKGDPKLKSQEIQALKGVADLVTRAYHELKKYTDQEGKKQANQ